MANKLIVLSADAMVTEDLTLFTTLPGYNTYLKGGSMVRSVRSIYPTVTYPCHGIYRSTTKLHTDLHFSLLIII